MKKNLLKVIPLLTLTTLVFIFSVKSVKASEVGCGTHIFSSQKGSITCTCSSGWDDFTQINNGTSLNMSCCGIAVGGSCTAGEEEDQEEPDPADGGDSILELTSETFDALNPLKIASSSAADELSTPGGIVSRLLNFLFPLAGLALFFLISWGGFEILIGATDQKSMEAGKNRITAAIVGFILLFSSYWLTQIVEVIFGISIL